MVWEWLSKITKAEVRSITGSAYNALIRRARISEPDHLTITVAVTACVIPPARVRVTGIK